MADRQLIALAVAVLGTVVIALIILRVRRSSRRLRGDGNLRIDLQRRQD